MVSAKNEIKGALLNEILGVGFRNQGTTVLAVYERLEECDAGIQQNCKCVITRRSACGCVNFPNSEGRFGHTCMCKSGRKQRD